MSELKAIPTRYKGYAFRSRLEVRWAGFFDLTGVKGEYEPEGFALPSGAQYLPDFRLTFERDYSPPAVLWCEVKPLGVKNDPKFDEFAQNVRDEGARLLAGDPLDYYAVGMANSRGVFCEDYLLDGPFTCMGCLARIEGGYDNDDYQCWFCDATTGSQETIPGLIPRRVTKGVYRGGQGLNREFDVRSHKGFIQVGLAPLCHFNGVVQAHAERVRAAELHR